MTSIFNRSDLIGKLAARAVANAVEERLENGYPVVYLEDETIYKEYPDGRREVLAVLGTAVGFRS